MAAVSGPSGRTPGNGSAAAAALNLTAVSGSQSTYLSVYPTDSSGNCSTSPSSSTLNVEAQTNQANRVIVPLGPAATAGPDTDVCVYNSLGTIDSILDANGWFGSSTAYTGQSRTSRISLPMVGCLSVPTCAIAGARKKPSMGEQPPSGVGSYRSAAFWAR